MDGSVAARRSWADGRGGRRTTTFDLVIIGAGAAGESAANEARELGLRVAIVDRRWYGGSCPHIACVPSKALLHAAAAHKADPEGYPWSRASARRDWMVNRAPDAPWPDDSGHRTRLEDAGVVVQPGVATIVARGEVEVVHDGAVHRLVGREIVVAVGSFSTMPDIPGLAEAKPWTNEQATLARELPRSLVVLGGGASGCEMAQVYARFGVPATLVHSRPLLAAQMHPRNAAVLRSALERDSVTVRTGVRAVGVRAGMGTDGARHPRPWGRIERRGARQSARGGPDDAHPGPRTRALRHRCDRPGRLSAGRTHACGRGTAHGR